MNISAKKLSIIEWLLNIRDETMLNKIATLAESKTDRWDELTKEQQIEINEAIAEIDRGEGVPHHTVMAKLRKR